MRFLLSFDLQNKFAIEMTFRKSKLFVEMSLATALNCPGNVVDIIQVLTLLGTENAFSVVQLEAGFTAKITYK